MGPNGPINEEAQDELEKPIKPDICDFNIKRHDPMNGLALSNALNKYDSVKQQQSMKHIDDEKIKLF